MSKTNTQSKTEAKSNDNVLSKYEGLPTVSAKIRAMHADGIKRSQIAKLLDKRYQHVRNVLVAPAPKKKELL